MEYFLKRKNVDNYSKMMEGYDNTFVVNELKKILPIGSSLLELGMGTGHDLIELAKDYEVTGSDYSQYFIEDFKKKSDLKALVLDAVSFDVAKKFDCIYSNKVLQHLKAEDFIESLTNQSKHLNDNGFIFMTLWNGDYKEEFESNGELRFVYYNQQVLEEIIPNNLELTNLSYYSEFDTNDSIIVVLRNK